MEIWGGGYYTILDKYTDTGLKEAAILQSPLDHQPCQVSLAQKLEPTNISPGELCNSAQPWTELTKLQVPWAAGLGLSTFAEVVRWIEADKLI